MSGGSIALLYDAVATSPLKLRHFRHESGAAFAATEGYFASGKPTLCFATTGPGLLEHADRDHRRQVGKAPRCC